jgi:predicted transcriptional regulator
MGNASPSERLSRRERQIMDVIYRRESASAAEVLADLPDPPSYSSVRALLRILEGKGHVTHVEDGPRYVFKPTHARKSAARAAMHQVIETFFGGSVETAVATMLSTEELKLKGDELERLEALIHQAKQSSLDSDPEDSQQ